MTGAERLPDEIELALAHTPLGLRERLRVAFELDQRLARIVAATKEPMLGQMRLAWWRDMLGKPVDERPTGDAVLDGIGEHLADSEGDLAKLVDGWEVLITADTLTDRELKAYAIGRSAPFVALLDSGIQDISGRLRAAASAYALADLAAGLSDGEERQLAIRHALDGARDDLPLPREARGLRILEALALRALKRGGRPLMEGRGAGLLAMRAAIFGR